MPFYKFNWGSKNNKDNLINNTEKGAINTKKINQFIKPDIEDSKKSNNDVDEELLILSIKHFIDTSFKKDSDINKMGYERVGALGGDEGYNFPGIITRMETGNYMDIPNQRYIEERDLVIGDTRKVGIVIAPEEVLLLIKVLAVFAVETKLIINTRFSAERWEMISYKENEYRFIDSFQFLEEYVKAIV